MVENLKTRNYFQKLIIHKLFNEKWYNRIKLFKIINYYRFGIPYEMSPSLKYLINKDSIVLDIGANMGQFACRFHSIIRKGKGHVYSFEPVSSNYYSLEMMKRKLNLQQVSLFKKGISNKEEEATIHIPLFDNGLVVGTRATLLNLEKTNIRTEKIQVTTIDNFVQKHSINNVDFIKCDTEGNELNVLEGGKTTIKQYLPVLSFEMSYKEEGLNWLKELGYEFYYFDEVSKRLIKIKDSQKGNLILLNQKHHSLIQAIAQ